MINTNNTYAGLQRKRARGVERITKCAVWKGLLLFNETKGEHPQDKI